MARPPPGVIRPTMELVPVASSLEHEGSSLNLICDRFTETWRRWPSAMVLNASTPHTVQSESRTPRCCVVWKRPVNATDVVRFGVLVVVGTTATGRLVVVGRSWRVVLDVVCGGTSGSRVGDGWA